MRTANDFILVLKKNQILPGSKLTEIIQSLPTSPEHMSASEFAFYLVDHEMLPMSKVNWVLEQLIKQTSAIPIIVNEPEVEPNQYDFLDDIADDIADVAVEFPVDAPPSVADEEVMVINLTPDLFKKEPVEPEIPHPPPLPLEAQIRVREQPEQWASSSHILEKLPSKTQPVPVEPQEPPVPNVVVRKGIPTLQSDTAEVKRQSNGRTASWQTVNKKKNQWDSPLVRLGVVSLVVIIMLGVVLIWMLIQRRAGDVLAIADDAYDNGAYTQSIVAYRDFIEQFGSHSKVSHAKIRYAFSRIRQITETRSNWDKALECVQEVLPTIAKLPDFAVEGQTEMSAILPNIAEGLAVSAEKTNQRKAIEQAETTLKLIEQYVPNSRRPFEQLQATERLLELTRRRLARDDELVKLKASIAGDLSELQSKRPDTETTRARLTKCYAGIAQYVQAHFEMRNDPAMTTLRGNVAKTEATFVQWVQRALAAKPLHAPATTDQSATSDITASAQNGDTASNNATDATSSSNGVTGSNVLANKLVPTPAVILASRTIIPPTAIPPTASTPNTPAPSPVFVCYADQKVYAVNTSTGEMLWRYHVGEPGSNNPIPLIISGLPDSNTLLADYQQQAIVLLNTNTGQIRYKLTIGEPFYINDRPMWPTIFLTTKSGKLLLVNLMSGKSQGFAELLQEVSSAPGFDPERRFVLQPNLHTALSIFQFNPEQEKPLLCLGTIITGHLDGTIRVAPLVHKKYLFIAEQTSPTSSTIKVYAPLTDPQTLPWSPEPVQTFPIDGIVETSPIANENDILFVAERGEIKLLTLVGENREAPYQMMAERIDESLKQNEIVSSRFAMMINRSVWLTDHHLRHFEIQPSRSRLIPRETPTTFSIISQSPMMLSGNDLVQMYLEQGVAGVIARSFSRNDLTSRWQLEFGEPVLAQPEYINANQLHLVTATGKFYDIPFSEITQPKNSPTYNSEAFLKQKIQRGDLKVPATHIVPLANGLEAICMIASDTETTNTPFASSFRVYDHHSPQSPIRTILVPAPLLAPVLPIGNGVAVPLANGQIALYSPGDGSVIADPLVAKRTEKAPPRWSGLTPILSVPTDGNNIGDDKNQFKNVTSFLVGDSEGVLRQVELVTKNDRHFLTATRSVQLPNGIVSRPIVSGRNIFIVDDKKNVIMLGDDLLTESGNALQKTTSGEQKQELQEPIVTSHSENTYGGVVVTGPLVEKPTAEAPESSKTDAAQSETSETKEPDLPYRKWELGESVAWGPYLFCEKNVLVATSDQVLSVLTSTDEKNRENVQLKQIPMINGKFVGKPFPLNETQLLMITQNGTLLRCDVVSGTLTPIRETNISPSCGPTVIDSKIVVFGNDGAIYTF